jgi:hypothetical protein
MRKHEEVIRAWLEGKDIQYFLAQTNTWVNWSKHSEISPMVSDGLLWRVSDIVADETVINHILVEGQQL